MFGVSTVVFNLLHLDAIDRFWPCTLVPAMLVVVTRLLFPCQIPRTEIAAWVPLLVCFISLMHPALERFMAICLPRMADPVPRPHVANVPDLNLFERRFLPGPSSQYSATSGSSASVTLSNVTPGIRDEPGPLTQFWAPPWLNRGFTETVLSSTGSIRPRLSEEIEDVESSMESSGTIFLET